MNMLYFLRESSLNHTKPPKESPWKRGWDTFDRGSVGGSRVTVNTIKEKFRDYNLVNSDHDIRTKRAALRVSASVVALISRPREGGEIIFKGSGTIYENSENGDGRYLSSIITSATLIVGSSREEDVDMKIEVYIAGGKMYEGSIVGYDVHYNIASINILSDVPLPVATLRHLDDSMSIDPALTHSSGDDFQLRPHSRAFKICAEEMVLALGRVCDDGNFDIMVAPGQFSVDKCRYDCMELLRTSCRITKRGIGGPLVNRFGEVIGLNFMNEDYTPFLAVNIVDKLLNHFKRENKFCRPWVGLKFATNLFVANAEEVEHIILHNPNISRGVFVESVVTRSPAASAGIKFGDVIVECNGKSIKGFLEFCREMLDKAGKSVELGVIRRGHAGIFKLSIVVEELTPDRFNRWSLPKEKIVRICKIRRKEECLPLRNIGPRGRRLG